ncbi:nischarin [Neocloeon triangulifer]|uniref:nischarin n=1 Tax=Neocloeon triangulifer TaxID=2078957 RepID=UPI00286F9920|nr:nischarin [Neocloeon triangulifer]
MANFLQHRNEIGLQIPYVERDNKVTIYVIHVTMGPVRWQVKHRYSAFAALHDILVADHGVSKELLPPKKVIGNQDPVFIEKRRAALETYLQSVTNFLKIAMPQELAYFLHFHQYEVLYLLQSLALQFFNEGDLLLQNSTSFKFTPLQLHAISERLRQPCPPVDVPDKRLDFSHVLDFCCQLTMVEVEGSNYPLNNSSLIPNKLPFNLSAFKSVRHLVMGEVDVTQIKEAQNIRAHVHSLAVHHSQLRSVATIAMCDALHKDICSAGENYIWHRLTELDLSFNYLEEIDESFRIMPHIKKLKLSHNKLNQVTGLTHLPQLSELNLSANAFYSIKDLHTSLGNVVHLDLSENHISTLGGFSKLYSLERLELASNAVSDVSEARHLSALPNLEYLTLTGNPVSTTVDYRTRVLERFGNRAADICLDNEKPNQKELDTIAILQVLRVVREGRTPPPRTPRYS